ncbi:hypothetical protein GALMADRAFT_153996 [Galerina marginata CBS 339.88]|uniref:Uncharacterized protein n=1 Tax=Galerina marginata (strain CBS 339.88) TaxID=685588 RepID=A0A067TKD1_GALM3|nr:hypothetical protein GALMADRAFT_153996 [Galerina marginata CBS 339.88]
MAAAEQNGTASGLTATSSKNDSLSSEDPYAELAIVEAEVESVSSTLAGLIRKLHNLKARINELHSPIVRLLPPEIVSEVFLFCIPIFDPFDEPPNTKDLSAPLKIGAVCSSWRGTAWATPSLWSTLTFHLTSSMKIPVQTTLLEEWLSRSGQLPLCIRLTSSDEVSWVGVSSEGMMKAIRKYAPRWRDVDIRLPSVCYRYLPPPEETENFPVLHSLTLKPPGGQADRIHKVTIPQSAELRYLALSCLYLKSVVFHFQVLTHLDLESFYVDEILEMLRQSTALVKFTARKILGGDDRHPIPEEAIVLPYVEDMCIINDKGAELQVMLEKISTPKLRKLSYTGDNLLSTPSVEIASLIKQSGCYLETLSISKSPIREEPFQLLLSNLHSVTALTLTMPVFAISRHTPLTDAVLQTCDPQWAQSNKVPCSLPELNSLTYSGTQGFTWATLLRVLDSRCPVPEAKGSSHSAIAPPSNAASCIRSVKLSLNILTAEESSSYPPPCQASLESLSLRGVKIASEIIIRPESVIDQSEE